MRYLSSSLAIVDRIEALDQETLSGLHSMSIIPRLIRVVFEIKQLEPVSFREVGVSHPAVFWWEKDRDGDEVVLI